MSKIRIKNFGPIKEGYLEDDGWLDVKKVTVFIGNQGSGKSTVAKLISTFKWMEKVLARGDYDLSSFQKKDVFDKYCEYHRINNYFHYPVTPKGELSLYRTTKIDYEGDSYNINYSGRNLHIEKKGTLDNYQLPQIMYVPAERNFLGVVRNAFDVKGIPGALFTFAEELRRSQTALDDKEISLPNGFGDIRYQYDSEKDTSYLIGDRYKLNLLNGASGFQSFIPLYIVSSFLSKSILEGGDSAWRQLSVSQSVRKDKEEFQVMLDDSLSVIEAQQKIRAIRAKYLKTCFVNIVEEPEQNLFPTSQWGMLKSLLEFNNSSVGNKLVMTTHSPYIVNYLTLAVKAGILNGKIKSEDQRNKLQEIVPLASVINLEDLVIYELDEKTGTIKKLGDYNGLPSDENYLNNQLEATNELFAQLLEIQQEL